MICGGGKKNINLKPYEIHCATISNSASIHLSYLVRAEGERGRAAERERGRYDLTLTKLN